MLKLYHNPSCSKSRQALKILEDESIPFEVIKYLNSPIEELELRSLIDGLKSDYQELVRYSDAHFKELGFVKSDFLSKEQIIRLLIKHPKLMQRPIVFDGEVAVIGRPSENIRKIL